MFAGLQEYALVAEVISAIAIIVSLLFVGFQIRDNTRATQASTFHDIAALDIQLLLHFANSKESARISTLFRESPEQLSDEDLNYGFYMFGAEVRHIENLFLQRESGRLAERSWTSRKALVEGLILSPGFEVLMDGPHKKYFDGAFIEYAAGLRMTRAR